MRIIYIYPFKCIFYIHTHILYVCVYVYVCVYSLKKDCLDTYQTSGRRVG